MMENVSLAGGPEELKAPWWQWLLFSIGAALVEVLLIAAGTIWLMFQGVDLMEYILVPRPTYITSGAVAAGFALLIAGQTVGPLLVVPIFRPMRILLKACFRVPKAGVLRRLMVGVLLFTVVQVVWAYVGQPPAEIWRLVDHLIYATARGGQFWPAFWLSLTVVAMAPVAEEIMFRGLTFGYVRRRWAFWPSAILSALLFGTAHGLANVLPTTLMALYFAYQLEKDDSIIG
ncbi:MAG: lysostaphin resistance A-like protein, partial [Mycobacterium leprae]